MQQYLNLLQHVLVNGQDRDDRTGTGTRSVFGYQMRFDLQHGFPLLTTKKLHVKAIIHELLWFLKGDTNIKYLKANGVNIWDEWVKPGTEEYRMLEWDERIRKLSANQLADIQILRCDLVRQGKTEKQILDAVASKLEGWGIPERELIAGDLGPVYGQQWRSWRCAGEPYTDSDVLNATEYVDQISNLIRDLQTNPMSRRLIVSAWNPADLDQMALPPCHCLFQFYVRRIPFQKRLDMFVEDSGSEHCTAKGCIDDLNNIMTRAGVPQYMLDCQLYQRSGDIFLGVPFNIASYALLTMMIAQSVNMVPGEFIHTLGDAHLYLNHLEQAAIQLERKPRQLPVMDINPNVHSLFDFKYEDFTLLDYDPAPHIKAEVSV